MQTPQDIIDRSYGYIVWIFAGLTATALFNLLSNMIRAIGDSKTPLYFLIMACIINIILDFFFIAVCGMDTNGAGLATVIDQLISGLLCIVYIVKRHPILHIGPRHLIPDGAMDKKLLGTGIPMSFLNMVLSVGSIVMQFVTNGLGMLYVSAQTTGSKIESFVLQPIISFGSSAAVFAAQNYGAKKYARILEAGRKNVLVCFLWSAAASVLMFFCGEFFIELLTGEVDEIVKDSAFKFLIIGTSLTFILSPLVIYKSILQSVGHNLWPTVSGFTEILARAGSAAIAMTLINSAILTEDEGFLFICLDNPLAWLFGLLTIIFDYIIMSKEFKRLSAEQKDE